MEKIRERLGLSSNKKVGHAADSNNDGKNIYDEYLDKYKKSFDEKGYDIHVQNNQVCIDGNGLNIVGDSVNTFWTAEDVLCKGDYTFFSNDNYAMIDIGLNIGLTTLSMARLKNIVKIYGYEPFVPTIEQAQRNLDANPELSKKIEIFNFGLGGGNKMLDVNYNPELPGAMSSVRNRFSENEKIEKIEIRRASEVLNEILLNKKESVFMKIDCEGAEGEILRDLDDAKLLGNVDLMVMEWHFENPHSLIEMLKKNNFVVFNEEVIKDELGFIRAVNVKKDK